MESAAGLKGLGPSGQEASRRAGGRVEVIRRDLDRLHHQAKSNRRVGGGVSMWPSMEDMRLSREDVSRLVLICASLVLATIVTFQSYHGI